MLGIDYGEKRIGLALSDPLGITAQPIKLLVRKGTEEDFDHIKDIVQESGVTRIVIGLPLNMDGSEGFMVQAVRKFKQRLQEKCGIEILELDERLTSLEAERILNQAAVKGKEKKKRRDSISAQIILQTYLNSLPT